MSYCSNILETIGNTPLVKLNYVTKGVKPTVLAKLEFFNPGGSIKDRVAFYMLQDAEERGIIKPGDTIVEETSGNTGIGLGIYAAIKGYKVIVTAPDRMSEEKRSLMRALGVKIVICPKEAPPDSPKYCRNVAKRIGEMTPNAIFIDQLFNKKNVEAHYKTTGPEIWEQTEHKVDVVVIGIGTGGTISGVGKFLKEKNPKIKIIGVDPMGSIVYDYFKHKKIINPYPYLVEGIGEEIICGTMDFEVIDDIIQVEDKDACIMARRLLKEEGIFAGGSSGAAVWATIEVARGNCPCLPVLDSDKIVVTILPDRGYNYLSKIYNDEWMREKFKLQSSNDK